MSPNQNPAPTAPPNPSKEGTPEWFYDEIMRFIEPDLLTNVIPTHAEKYAKQSKEECVARLTSYEHAFAVFDKASVSVAEEFHAEMKNIRDAAREEVKKEEKEDTAETQKALKKIEDKFDS